MKTELSKTRYTHLIQVINQCLKRQGKGSGGEKSLKSTGSSITLLKPQITFYFQAHIMFSFRLCAEGCFLLDMSSELVTNITYIC